MSNKILPCVMLLTAGFLVNSPLMAMQSESPVACIESPTSTILVYGDHATGCEILVPTDFPGFEKTQSMEPLFQRIFGANETNLKAFARKT